MQAGWIRREEEYIQVRKDCSVVSHKTNSIVDGPGQVRGPFSCLPQTVTMERPCTHAPPAEMSMLVQSTCRARREGPDERAPATA